jgi:hypothetical protein
MFKEIFSWRRRNKANFKSIDVRGTTIFVGDVVQPIFHRESMVPVNEKEGEIMEFTRGEDGFVSIVLKRTSGQEVSFGLEGDDWFRTFDVKLKLICE